MRILSALFISSCAIFSAFAASWPPVTPAELSATTPKVEKDARGLSEMEEDLVKVALDEKLMLAGKEPVFAQQED